MITEIKDAHLYADFRWSRLNSNTEMKPDRVVLPIAKQETEADYEALKNYNAYFNIYASSTLKEDVRDSKLFKIEIFYALTAIRREDKFVQEMVKI